jgi:thymidylate synthase
MEKMATLAMRCQAVVAASCRWRSGEGDVKTLSMPTQAIISRPAPPEGEAAPHYEKQYLDLMRHIWTQGHERVDRTGVGTRSVLGATMRFSLADDAVPLLTTKRVFWKVATREMLWFLSGETNIRPLVEQGVHIWTDWPLDRYRRETGEAISMEAFEQRIVEDEAFALDWGDLGPVYGRQWVNWPRYEAAPEAGEGLYRLAERGHNQIAALVEAIRANPGSRRLLFTGWNVDQVNRMALPPCHMTYQFHVADGRLNGLLFQRSCDLGLGFPFNIYGLALLTRMLALQCDLEPGEIVWQGGDVHLYLNHAELVEEQLSRTPAGAPRLRILRRPESIFDHRIEDFAVEDYEPQRSISAPIAV